MRVARRAVLVLLVAGAGSAVFASSAVAGPVDHKSGILTAGAYNATPYTWTLVAAGQWDQYSQNFFALRTTPAQTLAPGAGSLFALNANYNLYCLGVSWDYGYDGFFTYRVDVVGGPPEYVTVAITQWDSGPTKCGDYSPNHNAAADVYITSAPPPAGYNPAATGSPGSAIANPQIAYQHNQPTEYDQWFTVVGDYTFDASTPGGAQLADLVNSLCSPTPPGIISGTTCSFTQATPITYGPGDLTGKQSANNCDLSSVAPPSGNANPPPNNDPNYIGITWTYTQSASFSVGGGITASTEVNLFNTIASEASVSVEAEHEWESADTFSRTAQVYIPSNSWGFIWVAPTVGRITGTLHATVGPATYTANKFTEEHAGVSGDTDPRTQPIPAYNVVTKTRPMTAAELKQFCGVGASSRRRALEALKAKSPPWRLVPGRSVAQVALGETQEAVLARLGWPAEKRFALNPCAGMPGCTAVRGLGGTWNYKKRKLSVVFGPDRRVAMLIYSGNRTTRDGVGRDSTVAHLRGKFPRISCAKFARRIDCTVTRASGQQTTRTVFRLADRLPGHGTIWKTSKVYIYVNGRGRGKA